MRSTYTLAAINVLFVLALPAAANAQCTSRPSMTGEWKSNDGGTYLVRQRGQNVWWVGTSGDGGRTFINVFKGTRNGSVVTGEWSDVRGRGQGTLQLSVEGQSGTSRAFAFNKTGETGTGFGGRRWSFPCQDTG